MSSQSRSSYFWDAIAFIGSVWPSRRNLTGFYRGSRYLLPPSPLMQSVLNSPTNLIPALAGFISPLTPHHGPLCVPLCKLFFKAFPLNLAVSDVIFRISERQSSVCECFSTHHCPHYLLRCCPLLVNVVT